MKTINITRGIIALASTLLITVIPARSQTNITNDYGTLTLTPDGSGMRFNFDPRPTIDCDKIVFVQTYRIVYSNGGDVAMKSGDIWEGWRYRDKNTLDDGTVIDGVATCEDPYVNGDDRDSRTPAEGGPGPKEDRGEQGRRNATGAGDARWDDYPFLPDGLFPAGKTKVRIEFEICAMCAEGGQAGTVYGCTTWVYERTKGGGEGTSRHTGNGDLKPPSGKLKDALDKWEENHINEEGNRHCPD